MILLDDRVGSGELIRYFSPFGVAVEVGRLEFGDACWAGSGPSGDCMIGLERKRIGDMVQSMRDHRFAGHQLPGLMNSYEFCYLIVEGMFRPGDRGELQEWHSGKGRGKSYWSSMGMSYRELNHHLTTLEMKCGVVVRRSSTAQETVSIIVDLYKWWSEKAWDKHKSHQQLYAPTPTSLVTSRKFSFQDPVDAIRRKYGEPAVTVWKMAAQLPGLDAKAELVAAHFRTPQKMFQAAVGDWTQIKGIGKTLAERFVGIFG